MIIVAFFFIGICFLYLYNTTNYSFYAHLAAVFFEVALNITLIEVFLEYKKKKESFRIYTLARKYIFERVFSSLNKVIFKYSENLCHIDKLGNRPSLTYQARGDRVLQETTNQLLSNMNEERIIELAELIKKDFPKIEGCLNTHVVALNEDLLSSLSGFVDNCYQISLYNLDKDGRQKLVDSVQNDIKISEYDISWREVYHNLIYSWLYIINNFIYFSSNDTKDLREYLKSQT